MMDLIPIASITDAIIKGKQAVKGNFSLETGVDGNAIPEEERNYLRMFKANW